MYVWREGGREGRGWREGGRERREEGREGERERGREGEKERGREGERERGREGEREGVTLSNILYIIIEERYINIITIDASYLYLIVVHKQHTRAR